MDVFEFCLYSAYNRVRLNSIRDNELEEKVGEREEREREKGREGEGERKREQEKEEKKRMTMIQ